MWTKYVQPKIFSRVKQEGVAKLSTDYPEIFYTTSNQNISTPKFPTVYVHLMPGGEQGQALKGNSFNAFLCTVQIEVTDNKSAVNADNVMDVVMESMKKMKFSVAYTPETQFSNGVYRTVARFRRVIGSMDKF